MKLRHYAHPKPYHRHSTFGPGPRRPLDRNQVGRFRYLVNVHARRGNLGPKQEWVLTELADCLGRDGRCDPSHETLAKLAQVSVRTVIRALHAARHLGLLTWVCRLVRSAWRTEQTSNQYVLIPEAAEPPPSMQRARAIIKTLESGFSAIVAVATLPPPPVDFAAAQQARFAWQIAEEKRRLRQRIAASRTANLSNPLCSR